MLSIVTINKNNSAGLQKTVDSLNQIKDRNFQWVFIDSLSTDGSVAIANEFKFPGDVVVSEEDSGIYNAMNKGVIRSNGEWIMFLNSGDILDSQIQSLDFLSGLEGFDLALFGFKIRNIQRHPRNNAWRYWSMPTSHQAIIYSKALLNNFPFDESYRFAADFEHYLRINKSPIKIYRTGQPLIINESYGSDAHLPVLLKEYRDALIKNGYPKIWAHFVFWLKTFYLKWALRESN